MPILCTFYAAQNRSFKPKFNLKSLKLSYFCVFFPRPPSGVIKLYTSPMSPPFEVFSLDALNSEQKPSVKKKNGQRAGQPA